MPGIKRSGHWRSEIHVAETEHEIARIEDNALHRQSTVVESIDAADEFNIARAPGRVGPHGLHVLADGQQRGRVFPGKRQVDDARGRRNVVEAGDAFLASVQCVEKGFAGEMRGVVVDL